MTALQTILVADDNADDVFLLRQAFRRADATTRLEVVSDGIELFDYLEGRGRHADRATSPLPQAILMDLNMPRLTGFDVLARLRREKQWRRLMVHVMTTSGRASDMQRVYDLGANSYVTKPTRMDDLVEFVKALHLWHRYAWTDTLEEVARETGKSRIA
jgi:CheY-like chemotaxis protein